MDLTNLKNDLNAAIAAATEIHNDVHSQKSGATAPLRSALTYAAELLAVHEGWIKQNPKPAPAPVPTPATPAAS